MGLTLLCIVGGKLGIFANYDVLVTFDGGTSLSFPDSVILFANIPNDSVF